MPKSLASRWKDAEFTDDHPHIHSVLAWAHYLLPPLNFITIHYAYFVIVCLFASLVFWASSTPSRAITYMDSLFHVVSAMTEAGLNTVNLSQMNTWQQILLWLLIVIGSTIWVSFWTVIARKHVFEKRFQDIVRAERHRKMLRKATLKHVSVLRWRVSFKTPTSDSHPQKSAADIALSTHAGEGAHGLDNMPPDSATKRQLTFHGDNEVNNKDPEQGQLSTVNNRWTPSPAEIASDETASSSHGTSTAYQRDGVVPVRRAVAVNGPPYSPSESGHHPTHWRDILSKTNVSRNGQFHDLSSDEREKLGGCEYQALKILTWVIPIYFIAWQAFGGIALGAWIANHNPEAALSNGANPWWTGIFFAVSAFNNAGMSLLDANAIPFQESYFVLLTMGLLLLAGNTAYPLFLRLILWMSLKVMRLTTPDIVLQDEKAALDFILKYPRRVYTHLFPSRPTWWLFFMIVLLNSIDWVAFEVLNIGNSNVEGIPLRFRILDGLFQSLSVRSGGFYVIPISSLYIGLQVLYAIMVYISAYPVVITMRHSNVYEERSLGIYADDPASRPNEDVLPAAQRSFVANGKGLGRVLKRTLTFHGVGVSAAPDTPGDESPISFINHQIRGQLAHDLWLLVLAVLVITVIETQHFLHDPLTYSTFNIIFEVVSAYGTVGLSIGLPSAAYSFSGGWYKGSKLVLCLVMLRGRHRGLPVALDRAVRLPGEKLHREEEEDQRIRRTKTLGSPASEL